MPLNKCLHQALRRQTRSFAAISSSSPRPNPNTVGPYEVFNRQTKRMQRDRAALRANGERSRTVDYVRDEVADRMMERFLVRNVSFHDAAVIFTTFSM